jgi:excisionase family DNA binding protein
MDKLIQTTFTEKEFRKIIREEIERVHKRGSENPDLFIDAKGAALFLGLKQPYIYQLIHKTDIPHHKNGKKVLFKKSELEAWDQARKVIENNQGLANK